MSAEREYQHIDADNQQFVEKNLAILLFSPSRENRLTRQETTSLRVDAGYDLAGLISDEYIGDDVVSIIVDTHEKAHHKLRHAVFVYGSLVNTLLKTDAGTSEARSRFFDFVNHVAVEAGEFDIAFTAITNNDAELRALEREESKIRVDVVQSQVDAVGLEMPTTTQQAFVTESAEFARLAFTMREGDELRARGLSDLQDEHAQHLQNQTDRALNLYTHELSQRQAEIDGEALDSYPWQSRGLFEAIEHGEFSLQEGEDWAKRRHDQLVIEECGENREQLERAIEMKILYSPEGMQAAQMRHDALLYEETKGAATELHRSITNGMFITHEGKQRASTLYDHIALLYLPKMVDEKGLKSIPGIINKGVFLTVDMQERVRAYHDIHKIYECLPHQKWPAQINRLLNRRGGIISRDGYTLIQKLLPTQK